MDSNDLKMNFSSSEKAFERAKKWIPGGVNSPVRSFKSVKCSPVAIRKGLGSKIWDADGNEFIDYICSWGPLILGHAHPEVVAEISRVAASGTSFGAFTEREVEFAEMLAGIMPSLEMVRLVNSGTEAVMAAVRLARAYTRRDYVIKFAGGYHGHSDGLLAKAGSGLATQGLPGSLGVPQSFAAYTLTIPFNDIEALRELLKIKGSEIACLVAEPIPGNMGVVLPKKGYWHEVKKLLEQAGVLLVLDEVMTGFRVAASGAQSLLEIRPDLCTLGKIIGGGLPVGAFGGRRDIMKMLAPEGDVYQAGTLSGNPLAVSAGQQTLKILTQSSALYEHLEMLGATLENGLKALAKKHNISVQVNRAGSMLTLFFTGKEVYDFSSACLSDVGKYAQFFYSCLTKGVMLPPSQFEAWFISSAHSVADIEATLAAADFAFSRLHHS